jgi:hypothetical protein
MKSDVVYLVIIFACSVSIAAHFVQGYVIMQLKNEAVERDCARYSSVNGNFEWYK